MEQKEGAIEKGKGKEKAREKITITSHHTKGPISSFTA
jgi:hypothetical protein